ncbi:adenosine deaminase 2-like [Sitodiplosis mosellana]|uniref:adenosine deaminase 2-like n=1 Tax=Sitodiplosis mosellana TaxID=263140 RepID=UPI002444A560|nr:adenosine deaminase 2-like [Sitodiplosis mosellana]XP_055314976.1 adenosine deaminase 2-like [Sitodiplosis mosellana]
MATRSVFIIWLICIGVTFHVAQSAVRHRMTERCRRVWNEVDENNIVAAQAVCNSRATLHDYFRDRKDLLNYEVESSFGADIRLTDNEELANKIIMQAKEDEYRVGFLRPYLFNPARHIFEVLDVIKQSKLFQIIQKMPKGGILHAHDTALCSANYVVSLTYRPDLWQRTSSQNNEIEGFLFSREQPKMPNTNQSDSDDDSQWRLVKDVRDEMGAEKYDEHIRKLFTLFDKNVNPRIQFPDINQVWERFMGLFMKVESILTYAPVWKEYYKHALKEMQEDGVSYLEFRGTLPKLYDLDGNDYNDEDIMEIYIEALDEFKHENPSFIGSKFIYAPLKQVSNETAATYFDVVRRLHVKFPQFLAGFDLVGQEDTAPGLVSFAEHILQLPDDIKFFFHAGETNWFGSVDENLIDAVLLGSHRIGHGYALAKHPKVIDLVKSNDIAVEVNPISNQVLKLVDDYRNHPASVFLAQNVPVVISSDDPSFWEVSPLSHDFYMAFLGIASRHSDLRTLKKFAINSIQYSSLDDTEKTDAFTKWQIKWDKFIEDLVHNEL